MTVVYKSIINLAFPICLEGVQVFYIILKPCVFMLLLTCQGLNVAQKYNSSARPDLVGGYVYNATSGKFLPGPGIKFSLANLDTQVIADRTVLLVSVLVLSTHYKLCTH